MLKCAGKIGKVILLASLILMVSQSYGVNLPEVACDQLTFIKDQEVYLADPNNSEWVHLLHSPSSLWVFGPSYTGPAYGRMAWSSDGRKLAFQSEGHVYTYLYVVNANGSGLKLLFQTHDRSDWAWSPDGLYIIIATSTSVSGGFYNLNVISAETAQEVCYSSFNPDYYLPTCSAPEAFDPEDKAWFPPSKPKGDKLELGMCKPSSNGLWVACYDGDGVYILTQDTGKSVEIRTRVDYFFWTPSCEALKFSNWRDYE